MQGKLHSKCVQEASSGHSSDKKFPYRRYKSNSKLMGGRRGGLGYHELNNTDKHNKKREVFFLIT